MKWDSQYELGFKEIDKQHEKFVNMLDEFYQSIQQNSIQINQAFLNNAIQKIREHAKIHFATEEKYFDSCQYDHAEEHKKIHRSLIAKISEFENVDSDNYLKNAFEMIDFFEYWLVTHLDHEDRKYVNCLTKCGIK